MKFEYFLTYEELMEGYHLLETEKSTKKIIITQIILAAIVIMYLLRYRKNPHNFSYMIIAIAAVCLDFTIVYYPVLRRHYTARRQADKGMYRFIIDDTCKKVIFNDADAVSLNVDTLLIEGENVFAVRLSGNIVLCIPKRVINSRENDRLKELESWCREQHSALPRG